MLVRGLPVVQVDQASAMRPKNKTVTKRTILHFTGIMVEFNTNSEVRVRDDTDERSNAVFDGR